MTNQQSDFQKALQLSGIALDKSDIALVLELAKMCLVNSEPDLKDWSKVFAEHASVERKLLLAKPITPPKPERTYTTLTIAPGHCEWPKAC